MNTLRALLLDTRSYLEETRFANNDEGDYYERHRNKLLARIDAALAEPVSGGTEHDVPMLVAELDRLGEPVAYLDLGAGGYMDVGTDLSDEQLSALPKGRHMLGIIGTYGVDGYMSATQQEVKPSKISEQLAEEIYNGWRSQDGWTPWVPGGNSDKQDEARREARALLATQQEVKP